jgi:hypothetical protein
VVASSFTSAVGNGTGHPRGHQTLTRTLTRAGFDPKHPGQNTKKREKPSKNAFFDGFSRFFVPLLDPSGSRVIKR